MSSNTRPIVYAVIPDSDMQLNDTVKLVNPANEAERNARFILLERNGDRALIRLICTLPIAPVELVRLTDICAAKPDPRIAFFQVERRNGEPIARVIVSAALPVNAAHILAHEIADNPSDIPTGIAGVVSMIGRKAIPTFTLEAPGPDGWSPAPKGLELI